MTAPSLPDAVVASPSPARGGSALAWLSDRVALVGPDPVGHLAAVSAQIPPEPDVVTVVGWFSPAVDWRAVAVELAAAVRPGQRCRLAVAGAGAPLAALLGEELTAAGVLVPQGDLLLVPGGSLFAAGGWLCHTAAGPAQSVGRRAPRPDWEAAVDALTASGGGPADGLVRLPIAAGLWVYPSQAGSTAPAEDAPAEDAPTVADPVFSAPLDRAHPALVVGRPGYSAPPVDLVLALIWRLPAPVRRRLVIAPYGPGATVALAVARALATAGRHPVRMTTGLPAIGTDGTPVSVAGCPDRPWLPLSPRLLVPPDGPARPIGPVCGLDGHQPVRAGVYRLDERWVAELTQSGLWIRPEHGETGAASQRAHPWNPERLRIVISTPGRADPPPVAGLAALLAGISTATARHVSLAPEGIVPAADQVTGLTATAPAHGRPDLAVAPWSVAPPPWWRPDPRLFSVLVSLAADGTLHGETGVISPAEVGEQIAGRIDRAGRPVSLVAGRPVPDGVCQEVADQVQAVVLGGRPPGQTWSAVAPRRIDAETPAVLLIGEPPFPDADLARLQPPPGLPAPGPARPVGRLAHRLALRLNSTPEGSRPLIEPPVTGTPVALVALGGRTPRAPFQILERPVDVWFAATAIAGQRPEWRDEPVTILLEVCGTDRASVQLLANYLGVPVAVPADRLGEAGPGPAWFTACPRRPGDTTAVEAGPATAGPPGGVDGAWPAPTLQRSVALRDTGERLPPVEYDWRRTAHIPVLTRNALNEATIEYPVAGLAPEPASPGAPWLPEIPHRQRWPLPVILAVLLAAAVAVGYLVRGHPARPTGSTPVPPASGTSSPGLVPVLTTGPSPGRSTAASAGPATGAPAPGAPPVRPGAAAPPGPVPPSASTSAPFDRGRMNTSGGNLARGGAASASSVEPPGTFMPANAVDGDPNTRWGSVFRSDPQWLAVDLGSVYQVTSIRLLWQNAYATRYRIEVSVDGSTWRTVYSTIAGTGGDIAVRIQGTAARYVRMYGTARARPGYGYSIREFEIR
jgi:F5/8 type C domain